MGCFDDGVHYEYGIYSLRPEAVSHFLVETWLPKDKSKEKNSGRVERQWTHRENDERKTWDVDTWEWEQKNK